MKKIRKFSKLSEAKRFVRQRLRERLKKKAERYGIPKEFILKFSNDEYYAEKGRMKKHLVIDIDKDDDTKEITYRLAELHGDFYKTIEFFRITQHDDGWVVHKEGGFYF